MNKETQDQIAAVMLLHGTPEQQQEAIRYCERKQLVQPAELTAAERRTKAFHDLWTEAACTSTVYKKGPWKEVRDQLVAAGIILY